MPRTVISSGARNPFRLRQTVHMRVNGNGKPVFHALWDTVFHADGSAELVRKRREQRSLGCARDDDTRKCALPIPFLFRCVSQPPPLRGTSFHRKEGEPHAWGRKQCKNTALPYRHFERKREIFFVCCKTMHMRRTKNGKPVLRKPAQVP